MSLSIPNLKYGNQTTKLGPIVQSKYTLTQIRANKRSVWQVLLLLHRVHNIWFWHHISFQQIYAGCRCVWYEHHLKTKNSKYRLYTKRNSKQGFMNSRFNWFKNAFLCLKNIHIAHTHRSSVLTLLYNNVKWKWYPSPLTMTITKSHTKGQDYCACSRLHQRHLQKKTFPPRCCWKRLAGQDLYLQKEHSKNVTSLWPSKYNAMNTERHIKTFVCRYVKPKIPMHR